MSPSAELPVRPAPARDPFKDPEHFHPLEVFPFFRRWKPAPLRELVYTFIWNGGIGFAFWIIGGVFKAQGFQLNDLLGTLITANAIGYTLHAMFIVTSGLGIDKWAHRRGLVFTAAYYTLLSTAGVLVGFLVVALAFEPAALEWMLRPRWIGVMGLSSGLISLILALVFFSREREARTEAALERERLRAGRIERDAALSELRALQAQIEPHFLFNTLANVASLIEPDPATARRMLESFIRFLRASLAATRQQTTTLGDEGALIAAYLQVLQVRMGARLRYRIEIDPAIAGFELAPMLLQPVVENAIRHGLEPKVEGGEVVFRARRAGADVVIEVADTGVGFQPTTRGGVGLANLRDRLRLLYGDRATLRIAENTPPGTVVSVSLPA
ncbi:MAG TPA: sensor histidine kinase [Usitatibacter sp.]|nr:sensor histidine kinase [Usitatibacter sp.]